MDHALQLLVLPADFKTRLAAALALRQAGTQEADPEFTALALEVADADIYELHPGGIVPAKNADADIPKGILLPAVFAKWIRRLDDPNINATLDKAHVVYAPVRYTFKTERGHIWSVMGWNREDAMARLRKDIRTKEFNDEGEPTFHFSHSEGTWPSSRATYEGRESDEEEEERLPQLSEAEVPGYVRRMEVDASLSNGPKADAMLRIIEALSPAVANKLREEAVTLFGNAALQGAETDETEWFVGVTLLETLHLMLPARLTFGIKDGAYRFFATKPAGESDSSMPF